MISMHVQCSLSILALKRSVSLVESSHDARLLPPLQMK